MNKDTLEKMAITAFDNLKSRRDNLFTKAESVIEAQAVLETAKYAAFTSGKVDGKNEETRKAQLAEITKNELAQLKTAEGLERAARYQFDLAQIDLDTLKVMLRIAELME